MIKYGFFVNYRFRKSGFLFLIFFFKKVSIVQLLRKNSSFRRKVQCTKRRVYPVFQGNPHQRGTIIKIRIESPKKPNSAKRRVAQVKVHHGRKIVRAKLQGIKSPGTQKFASVLLRGARPRDLPGVRCVVIRGKFGCTP